MNMMQIGTGRWGTNHLRVLSGLPVNLYVAEVSAAERAKCLAQGIPADHVTADYRTFLDMVSAVDVVTPAPTHFPLCKEIMEKGKAVFVEKPIAATVAEAEELTAIARRTGIVFQVGHIFRFDPAVDYIREILAAGQLGAIQSLSGSFSGFKRPRSDGGVTISDAIHFIDLFNYLLGRLPQKVLARCEDILQRNMDDLAWIWMDYNGISAMVEANYFSPDKKRTITLTGQEATLVCDFTASQDKIKIFRNRHILDNNTWKTVGGEIISKEIPPAEPLLLELREFLHCVNTRSLPRAPASAGLEALKVVEAAVRSHREERVVHIDTE